MSSSHFRNVELRPDETMDAFMDGRLHLIQSRDGYRFSVDALLLSEFVTIRPGDVLVDLGTGCGVIPFILLLTRPVAFAVGVEIQPDLANQARRNIILNGFKKNMAVVLGDVRRLPLRSHSADVVLCNPPYRKKGSGRVNPDPQRAIARHEITLLLDDILEAAGRLLKHGGRLAVIYPASRLADALVRMRGFRLEPKRIRVIYPSSEREAKLILIEATYGGRAGLKILPPLFDPGDLSIKSKYSEKD